MKTRFWMHHTCTWLAVGVMICPVSFAAANEPAGGAATTKAESKPATLVRDVALAPGGLLIGQVLDDSMRPMVGKEVAIQAGGKTAAKTTTDADGVFAVAGLRGGVHQVFTKDSTEVCRLWAPGTAPPRAATNLRFVPGQNTVVRGQIGHHKSHPFLHQAQAAATNPWVVGGVILTAVAVPVILNNTGDDDHGS